MLRSSGTGLAAFGRKIANLLRAASRPGGELSDGGEPGPPGSPPRVYVSVHNEGAMALADEHGGLNLVHEPYELEACAAFLLYLGAHAAPLGRCQGVHISQEPFSFFGTMPLTTAGGT